MKDAITMKEKLNNRFNEIINMLKSFEQLAFYNAIDNIEVHFTPISIDDVGIFLLHDKIGVQIGTVRKLLYKNGVKVNLIIKKQNSFTSLNRGFYLGKVNGIYITKGHDRIFIEVV